jgi:ribosome maturation factor RimP
MHLDTKEIEAKAEKLIAPVLENMGYGLVACDFLQEGGRWILRLYIEKEGGVTIDDCVRASHGVEDLIAVEDIVPVGYSLEVSSPGINRPLRKRADFERYVGERIAVKTQEPIEGRKNFKGLLTNLRGDEIVMIIDGSEYSVPIDSIGKAHLEPTEIVKDKKIH